MPTPLTNRQMALNFLNLGFQKSDIALSRNAHYWKYPGTNALFFYSKFEDGGVGSSCPNHEDYSFPIGLRQEKFEKFLEMGVDFSFDENGQLGHRQALLDIAEHFVKNLEPTETETETETEPDPDSIMGIMADIKRRSDAILGGE